MHVASYLACPCFSMLHAENQEGPVDFGDVMDVVCYDSCWTVLIEGGVYTSGLEIQKADSHISESSESAF